MRNLIKTVALGTALAVAGPAMAAETIWLDSTHTPYGGDYGFGQALSFSGGSINVSVTGWSINGSGTISAGSLGVWSGGIGVKNSANDNSHTVDNSGWRDFVILEFDQLVSLDQARLNTGWHNFNDTDATLGFFTGSLASLNLNGANESVLDAFNPYNVGEPGNSGSVTRNVNAAGNVGSVWLLGATWDDQLIGNDGFKIDRIEVHSAVPEPSTWALMLLGFGFVGGAMRHRRRKEAAVNFAF